MSKWSSLGSYPPASNSPPAATAGASAIYYRHDETGEYAFRPASWGDHGTGVHGFRDYGDATGCDEWGRPNGKTYPAAEF